MVESGTDSDNGTKLYNWFPDTDTGEFSRDKKFYRLLEWQSTKVGECAA